MPRKIFKRKINRRRIYRRRRYVKKSIIPMSRMPPSLRPEIKRLVDQSWTAQTLSNAGSAAFNFNIDKLAQGDNYNQRQGDRVFSKGFYIKGIIEGSSSNNYVNYRIDVIRDRQPAATSPGWTDIYLGGGATNTDNMNAVLNPNNRQRFKILKTFKGTVQSYLMSTTGPTVTPGVKHFTAFIRSRHQLMYNNTGNSTPNDGYHYFIVGWSDVTANTPQVFMTVEHSYTDV